jgi:hypothetical protein
VSGGKGLSGSERGEGELLASSGLVAPVVASSDPVESGSDDDPIDPHYKIPVSYVRRYQAHAADLNQYITDNPKVGEDMEAASDEEAGRLLMHLLDVLELD